MWGGMTEQERRAYRINHEITLVRPEAMTIDGNHIGLRKQAKMKNYLRQEEEVDEWL